MLYAVIKTSDRYGEILGSQRGEFVDDSLFGCCAV
jgi:hypothetical protein